MIRILAAVLLMNFLLAPESVSADPLSMKLVDGFEGKDFSPQGGLYYKDNEEQRAGTVEFQGDVTHGGKGALKLSVKSLCAASEDGCSERAEIWEKPKLRVPYESAVWFGFAVKFADPIPQDDHRYLIAQWKREVGEDAKGDFSPFIAFRLRKGKLFITVETGYVEGGVKGPEGRQNACADGGTPVWLRPETNQMRAIVAADATWTPEDGAEFNGCTQAISVTSHGNSLPAPDSGWIDFAVMSKAGPSGDGHVEIFANGKWIVTIKGHIGHSAPGMGPNQYFKFGPYRAAREGEWSMYYDDFRRSPDCADVLGDAAACALVK